ncbi:MAG: family 20 glycosylhydrolase [Clostridia bacterium]|nr:family 20 glycosylhydrolase [Clostridia bacterium]
MGNTAFYFGDRVTARMPKSADAAVLSDIWNGFCSRASVLDVVVGEDNRISIGNADFLPIEKNDEFTVRVTPQGVGIVGRDTATLVRGFSSLMMRIEMYEDENGRFCIPIGDIHGAFSVDRRMIHYCVFPNTTLTALRRLVRLCGVLSYTHVVLEFWGMLKYDCLAELAWKNAFSKEEIAPIIREARALGVEPIPMINHLGHASSCRIDSGKHVVLDQNPRLQHLFTPDGWCWRITSERPKALLRQMRAELCELFGNGDYFHIGCDEAHFFSSEYYPLSDFCDYMKELTAEVISEGRRPILWGDMIVPLDTNAESEEKRAAAKEHEIRMRPVMDALHRESVIADWHYDAKKAPVTSSLIFKEKGFDVLGCPWDKTENIDAHYATATESGTYGLMMTTWHTLHTMMHCILHFARRCGLPKVAWSDYAGHRNLEIATILRKISPEHIDYADSGFCPRQLADTFAW